MKATQLTPELIASLLAAPGEPEDQGPFRDVPFRENPRPAAVLIPFQLKPGPEADYQIIFTRRTDTVADHKNQVAFPGGRAEAGDPTLADTALREAYEEIGLQSKDVVILGQLSSLLTISNYLVTPVIGVIPYPYSFSPEPGEVSKIFGIPLSFLADPENHEIRQREVGFPLFEVPQSFRVIYFKPYQGETLWGVSAEITLRLMNKLKLID